MRALIVVILALVALAVGPQAFAEKRVALVVGVGGYQSAPALANPLNDAADVAASLQAAGFQVVEAYDPDYAKLQQAVRDYGRALDGATVGLVYYAGHGVQVDGRNFLLPVDVTLKDDASLAREAVDVAQIMGLLAADRRISLVLLDACRDNPLAANLARRAGAARSAAVSQGLAQISAVAPDTLVAYSTQPGAVAADGGGRNSPFTAALLRHLDAPGLDVTELMRRVRRSVIESTNGVQVPWDNSSLTTGFAFVAAAPGKLPPTFESWQPPRRDPSPRQLDVAMWNDVKAGSIEELQSYLKRYPAGIFADLAKARIATLQKQATARRDDARQMAADIAKEFALIAGRGAIVENPKEAADFYGNARLYELRGDFVNARRSYLGLFRFGLPYVDPHYRFQSFLRVQEGRAGAREVYQELAAGRAGDAVFAYAQALLLETEQRKAALEGVLKARPDFAPAYYELARNFSQAQLGSQTQADQAREQELLKRFVELAEKGRFLGWFIDQTVAAEQLDDARKRLAALAKTLAVVPVSMTAARVNTGWLIYLNTAELPEEMFVALPGAPERSLGFTDNIDNRTGRRMAKGYFELPTSATATSLSVRYRDASGQMRGPFVLRFDPDRALEVWIRQILDNTSTGWLHVSREESRTLVYFTHIVTSRCVIKEVRYSINSMSPSSIFELPICDKRNPNDVPSDAKIYLETPVSTSFVSVQITYLDGSKSGVFRFEPK